MIKNTLFNQNMSGGCIIHLVEYDGYLFSFDNEGYSLYKQGYCDRLGSEGFWESWWDDRADFFIIGEDFKLWSNDEEFLDINKTLAEKYCEIILEDLMTRELL